ncbi:MAG TPA: TPM domain-containing protein [Planctomycetota bacterium]|nr:TPM domain-containing protein [Planctomycetota bacterium]
MERSSSPDRFLTHTERVQVEAAVAEAELRTSAEVKLVIARYCWSDIRAKAAAVFRKLGLDKTAERNAVLILLVTTNREFLIHGDEGIHQKVGQGFWDDVRGVMEEHFREGRFGEGLAEGIRRIGGKLADHFPRHAEDKNEIPDEVAFEQ